MRRIAAAFSRRDRAAEPVSVSVPTTSVSQEGKLALPALPAARRSGFFSKAPHKQLEPVHYDGGAIHTPPLATPTSSASSDASSSMRTPDDGDELPIGTGHATISRTQSKWKAFLRRNKSGTALEPAAVPVSSSSSQTELTSRSQAALPQRLARDYGSHLGDSDSSADDDSDDSDDDERYNGPAPRTPGLSPTPISSPTSHTVPIVVDPVFSARAQTNLRALTQTVLDAPPAAPHPLLAPIGHVFPRSSNASRVLDQASTPSTMVTILHRSRLLHRLDARNLTPTEQASVLPFRFKSSQKRNMPSRHEQEAVLDQKKLLGWSRGISDWLKRPTFEQRAVLWTMQEDDVLGVPALQSDPIQGSNVAVAELEFSDGLLALASSEATVAAYAHRKPAESAGGVRRNPSIRKSVLTAAAARARAKSAADNEDEVPLGVMLKLRREQAERKRAAEEQRRREHEERLRAMEEARQRAAREEDRQRKSYADEVLAARMRRERERQGSQHGRGNPFSADRGLPPPRRSPSEPAPVPAPSTTPPPADARSDKSKRRSASFTPRPRSDSTKSREEQRASMAIPTRTAPARQSALPDQNRLTMAVGTDPRRVKAERRGSTVSESGTRSSYDSRTLPRSFRPESAFMPPPIPALHRHPSLVHMSGQQQIPVFVPVFIPQPVTPTWGVDFSQMMAPSEATAPSPYGRRSASSSRVSLTPDRFAAMAPSLPRTTQIQ